MPVPRAQLLVEEPEHVRERMDHQPPADHAAAVAQAVGMARPGGEQQQARGADRVRREHDDVGLLDVLLPVARHVLDAGGQPVAADQHATDARAGDELGAVGDGLLPVGVVGARLRALGTAPQAAAPLRADPASVGGDRQHRVGARPPVPAEPGVRAGDLQRAGADRQRRVGRLERRRVGGVAAEPGGAELDVGLLVVGPQVLVADRPVVGHAVLRAHAEVRRMQPRPVAGVQDQAAADAVEHQRRDVGVVLVDRVVLRPGAVVRAVGPLLARQELELRSRRRELVELVPVALLEADHVEPGRREPARDDASGRSGADDQHVGSARAHAAAPFSSPTSSSVASRRRRSASSSPSSGGRTLASSSTPRIRSDSFSRAR